MRPKLANGNVQARCPDCGGAITTFERKNSSRDYGSVVVKQKHQVGDRHFTSYVYGLMRCAGCGRGGLAKFHDAGETGKPLLDSFYPTSPEHAKLPASVPHGVEAELREAERCASIEAWRAASGLVRSTLEKLLRANGYAKGTLAERIDLAAADGVITEARRKRAHDDIRVLGNDVLHDDWREVKQEEVEAALHYAQRIIEDLYDDRPSVETILKSRKRMP